MQILDAVMTANVRKNEQSKQPDRTNRDFSKESFGLKKQDKFRKELEQAFTDKKVNANTVSEDSNSGESAENFSNSAANNDLGERGRLSNKASSNEEEQINSFVNDGAVSDQVLINSETMVSPAASSITMGNEPADASANKEQVLNQAINPAQVAVNSVEIKTANNDVGAPQRVAESLIADPKGMQQTTASAQVSDQFIKGMAANLDGEPAESKRVDQQSQVEADKTLAKNNNHDVNNSAKLPLKAEVESSLGSNELKKIIDNESRKNDPLRQQLVPSEPAEEETKIKVPELDSKQGMLLARSDTKLIGWARPQENLLPGNGNFPIVKPEELISQIVNKAHLTLKENVSEIKLQLNPEFLGKMTIKLLMEDGVLTAKFITDNHNVKSIIESNLAALRASFEAQGIKVEKTEVGVQVNAGNDNGSFQNGQQQMQQQMQQQQYQARNSNLDEVKLLNLNTAPVAENEQNAIGNWYYDFNEDQDESVNYII